MLKSEVQMADTLLKAMVYCLAHAFYKVLVFHLLA